VNADDSVEGAAAWDEGSVLAAGNAVLQDHCREWKYHQHHIGIRFFRFIEDAGRPMPQTLLNKLAPNLIG